MADDLLPRCLLVTAAVDDFLAEVRRVAPEPIPLLACRSAEALLDAYRGESILFGNPGMIAPVIDRLPAVRWVQSTWAGVTPLVASPRRDYVLTGVRDVFGPQMSEYVFGYLLAHELKIDMRKSAQRDHRWCKTFSGALRGKTIGIMGTGSIGRHLAGTARHFGMRVVGLSRSGAAAADFDAVAGPDGIDDFLRSADHLVTVLPQTPATDRLLDARRLALLGADSCFVNIGRSNIVDDAVLVEALGRGHPGAAVLDVFDEEPLPADSVLWDAPNLAVTAHIAAVSHPSLIVPIFVDNYRRYVAGQALRHVVDFDAGY